MMISDGNIHCTHGSFTLEFYPEMHRIFKEELHLMPSLSHPTKGRASDQVGRSSSVNCSTNQRTFVEGFASVEDTPGNDENPAEQSAGVVRDFYDLDLMVMIEDELRGNLWGGNW